MFGLVRLVAFPPSDLQKGESDGKLSQKESAVKSEQEAYANLQQEQNGT